MQTSLCTAVQNNTTVKSHSAEIQGLKEENLRLNQKVQQLTVEQNCMKRQITKIETKGLDQCLIIRGLPEEPKKQTNGSLTNCIVYFLLLCRVKQKKKSRMQQNT